MPKPRIFVSHSAKEPEANALLGQLADALRTADFDPYVADERMRRGDNFVDKLREELSICAGAVILLSPTALKSYWVQQEVMVLTLRHAQEKDGFPILPLLICGTTRDAVKTSRLGVLGLPNLHAPTADRAAAVPEIVGMFRQLIGPPRPLRELELNVAALLDRVNDDLLHIAAEELEVDMAGWQPRGMRHAVARHLLAADLAHFSKAMAKIGGVIDQPILLINLIFPFTWIDGQAAAPLAEAATGTAPRLSLAINSDRKETGRWYVHRACTRWPPWPVVETGVAEGESYDEALVKHVREALLEILGYFSDDEVPDARLAAELEQSEQVDGPIFILLPPSADATSVARLREHFPRPVFVVLTGPQAHDQFAAAGIRVLTPLLDPSVERESLRGYDRLVGRVSELKGVLASHPAGN